jgi:hypothetical protein
MVGLGMGPELAIALVVFAAAFAGIGVVIWKAW